MGKIFITFYFSFLTFNFFGQTVNQKLQKAFTTFENDSQLKHAISSLYVIDATTGQVVFDKNSQIGLAPASTQKIITSVTAFELLGKDYRYKTEVRGDNNATIIVGGGDPSLGSWRFDKDGHKFFSAIITAFREKNRPLGELKLIDRSDKLWPDGWIYQDIGNYYGASAYELNWGENQFDITFIPGQPGDPAAIDTVVTDSRFWNGTANGVKTGPKGSGDNAYIYIEGHDYIIQGTVPAGVKSFTISGANHYPQYSLATAYYKFCDLNNIAVVKPGNISLRSYYPNALVQKADIIYTHYSPKLDSIIYWFNKKSINLYGEALIKTVGYEKKGFGSTDSGVVVVKKFWKEKGMDENELNIVDGSGLSPLNRVTTHAQVEILKYAKTKDWFPYFFTSLPEYNGMKIKSGTIRGVKGFCGYHKAKSGKEYIFSFLVNNYSGASSTLVNKMYKVMDILK